ncbi:MAG: antiviral reverse transcriptase Drt3b [Colwellia sp.]
MKKFKARIDKKDHLRALLSDTSTGDIPIIFSNDGFYLNLRELELGGLLGEIERKLLNYLGLLKESGGKQKVTIPYKYYIRKNEIKLRTLSLVHPNSQVKYSEFYGENSSIINYLCSRSESSIRAPIGISNSFYIYGRNEINKYKNTEIELDKGRFYSKYVKSYFYYSGYRMMYKFFNGGRFLSLEKKYSHMTLIDISDCFGSIYTHSISWAIKGKAYSKANTDPKLYQFTSEFDRLIQCSNHQETNGIPVGSEISRVFSEIILQRVDLDARKTIKDIYALEYSDDYEFYRYVDDYIIFVKDNNNMDIIVKALSDAMGEYNLNINDNKVKNFDRPFETEKSAVVSSTKETLDCYFNSHMTIKSGQGIFNENGRGMYFKDVVSKLKRGLALNSGSYGDISGLAISSITNKLMQFKPIFIVHALSKDRDRQRKVHSFVKNSFELMAFLFSVSPKVPSSYSLAKAIVIYNDFYSDYLPDFYEDFKTHCQSIFVILDSKPVPLKRITRATPIESINILLAMSKFGEGYLESPNLLIKLLSQDDSYFTIISLLAYVKDYSKYNDLRIELEELILKKCQKSDPSEYSETAHLILDVLSCPYISGTTKIKLLKQAIPGKNVSAQQYVDSVKSMGKKYWFVNWLDLNLITLLQRSRLMSSY